MFIAFALSGAFNKSKPRFNSLAFSFESPPCIETNVALISVASSCNLPSSPSYEQAIAKASANLTNSGAFFPYFLFSSFMNVSVGWHSAVNNGFTNSSTSSGLRKDRSVVRAVPAANNAIVDKCIWRRSKTRGSTIVVPWYLMLISEPEFKNCW